MTSKHRPRDSEPSTPPALDGIADPDALREAIEKHIAQRRADPEFQARLQRLRDEEDRRE